jgi:Rieske Fe-S protein
VAGTVNNDRCNHAGCDCVPGELEIDEGLTPFAKRWADLGNGRIFCPACWKDQFRFEAGQVGA